jgi:hypothetical protein
MAMKIGTLCVFMGFLAMIAGCMATGESYYQTGYDFCKITKIAVLDVTGPNLSDAAKNQIADFFAMELLKKGFAPVERAQVWAILEEQKFQTSGETSSQDAARAGRILNVPAVILVNIPVYDESISMTAKMVNVEDGSIMWAGSGSGSTGRMLSTIFGSAAGAAAGAAIGGEGHRTGGAIAGGVLGGATGFGLSPQQAEQFQKIIKKVCANLPERKMMTP